MHPLLIKPLAVLAILAAGCRERTDSEPPDLTTLPPRATVSPSVPGTLPAAPGPTIQPVFKDVARSIGLDHTFFSDTVPGRFFLPEIMGGGAAWGDFNRDDVLDVYLMNGCPLDLSLNSGPAPPNRLFLGDPGGRFRAVPDETGVGDRHYGQGCAAGDFDADGFTDLYLGNYGPNALLRNNGDGTFSDVTNSSRTDDPLWTSSVVWLDVDGDDDLDLYVTNYLDVTLGNRSVCDYGGSPGYCGPGQYAAASDHLFINQSDGTFVEAARDFGILDDSGKGLAVVAADLNGDFVPEIYVANDMTPNFLFVRETGAAGARVQYRERATTAGCAQSGDGMNEASMGIACADFDGDGWNDLYLTHYYQSKNTLYQNLGNLMFDDVSLRMGVTESSYSFLGFGVVSIDFDRDGFDDLFVANGHVLGPQVEPNKMRAQLLRNLAGRRFEDVSAGAGPYFEEFRLGRGVASADYDNDGDLDVLVTHLDEPVSLLRNDTPVAGHFLGLRLERGARVPPVGARVRVYSRSGVRTKTQLAGGSYLCQSDERLLFALPSEVTMVDVEVTWPDQAADRFDGLPVNRYWRLSPRKSPRELQ